MASDNSAVRAPNPQPTAANPSAYVAAWEFAGEGKAQILNKEPLEFQNVHLATRSYK